MHRLFVVFIAVILLGGDDEKDVEKMQGTWWVETIVINGTTTTLEKDNSGFVTIHDKTTTSVLPNGLEVKGTLTFDPKKSPKEFDLRFEAFPNGKTMPPLKGIYEIEKDSMKWCVTTDPDGKRPTEFTADVKENRRLQIFKRK